MGMKAKYRPIPVEELLHGQIADSTIMECQHCLTACTAFEARARFFRVGRCAKCNGMLRRARKGSLSRIAEAR